MANKFVRARLSRPRLLTSRYAQKIVSQKLLDTGNKLNEKTLELEKVKAELAKLQEEKQKGETERTAMEANLRAQIEVHGTANEALKAELAHKDLLLGDSEKLVVQLTAKVTELEKQKEEISKESDDIDAELSRVENSDRAARARIGELEAILAKEGGVACAVTIPPDDDEEVVLAKLSSIQSALDAAAKLRTEEMEALRADLITKEKEALLLRDELGAEKQTTTTLAARVKRMREAVLGISAEPPAKRAKVAE